MARSRSRNDEPALPTGRLPFAGREAEVRKGLAILGVTDVRFLRLADDYVSVTRSWWKPSRLSSPMCNLILLLHNPTEELVCPHRHRGTALKAIGVAKIAASSRNPEAAPFPPRYSL